MNKSHLFVRYSCKKYETTRIVHQSTTWPTRLPPWADSIVMTGNGDGTIGSDGVLRLNCQDDYHTLINKTQCLFDWFLTNTTYEWLVKIDDDVWLNDTGFDIIKTCEQLYGGFGRFPLYYSGTCYWIHRSALQLLPRLHTCVGDINAEDMTVGNALRTIGIHTTDTITSTRITYNASKPLPTYLPDFCYLMNRDNVQPMFEHLETMRNQQKGITTWAPTTT